jgi:thioredoxin-related protein
MIELGKKAEFLTSILILVSSVFLSEFLLHKYIFSSPATPDLTKTQPESAVNHIEKPNFDWSERPKTLVLALQTSCGYCNRSAPFYQRLIANTAGKNVRLVAVIPGDIRESRTHMEKLGLKDLDIRAISLDSINVDGTPTLLLVNEKGDVTDYWVGKLPPDKEDEVIRKVTL